MVQNPIWAYFEGFGRFLEVFGTFQFEINTQPFPIRNDPVPSTGCRDGLKTGKSRSARISLCFFVWENPGRRSFFFIH